MTLIIPNNQETDSEFTNFEYFWYQGDKAFKNGVKSIEKIFKLLKSTYGSFSPKDILQIMYLRLCHLNGMSYWKLKIYLEMILIE